MSTNSAESTKSVSRRLIWLAAKILVAASILAFLFIKVGSLEVLHTLGRLHWWVFIAAVFGYCCMQALKTYRLKILMDTVGSNVSYPRLLLIYFIGMFFNTVLPTIVGGDAVRIAYLRQATGRLDCAAAATITERAIGVGALVIIALGALGFAPSGEAGMAVKLSVLVVSAGFLAAMALLFSPWVYRLASRCMRALRLEKLERFTRELQEAVATYRRRPAVLIITLLLSLLAEFIMIGLYGLLAYGMGLRVHPAFFLMAVPITVLVSMAPITISGLGVRELTWVFFLSEQGVPEADAIALSLMWFILVTAASAFGGPAFVFWRKRRRGPQPAGESIEGMQQD